MFDVVACGELLIDFVSTESGVTLAEAPAFKKAAGGAPANVAVGLARLGYRAGFLGQVGDDDFGHFLADTLGQAGVDTNGLRFTGAARTALAFVSLRSDGERSFVFYRHPSADMLWRPEDVNAAYAGSTRIFHYGSISLIGEPSRSATLAALGYARNAGALISYDPNLRLALWDAGGLGARRYRQDQRGRAGIPERQTGAGSRCAQSVARPVAGAGRHAG
jgi:fructokinase